MGSRSSSGAKQNARAVVVVVRQVAVERVEQSHGGHGGNSTRTGRSRWREIVRILAEVAPAVMVAVH